MSSDDAKESMWAFGRIRGYGLTSFLVEGGGCMAGGRLIVTTDLLWPKE